MNDEVVFRFLFLAYYLLIAGVSIYFRMKVRKSARKTRSREMKESSGWLRVRRLTGLLMIATAILYVIHPPFMALLAAALPVWLRWSGVVLAILSLPLLVWVLRSLDKQWSRKLELRDDHELVTNGPYGWGRHPMYALIFLSMSCLALISANWILIVLAAFSIFSIYSRIDQEEAMMIQRFGNEYRSYQQSTGRLFPRF